MDSQRACPRCAGTHDGESVVCPRCTPAVVRCSVSTEHEHYQAVEWGDGTCVVKEIGDWGLTVATVSTWDIALAMADSLNAAERLGCALRERGEDHDGT